MNKASLLANLFWDYDLSPQDCLEVLEGHKQKVGHYTRGTLTKRLLESYPWFVIIEILSLGTIKNLLTDEVINSLRSPNLRERYEYISKRLSKLV